MAAWLEFESDRFDHTSELPPDANAGNRFYGRDVAEFIVDGLTARGYESHLFGEDWGWFVRAARPSRRATLEISIYHDIGEHTMPGCWALNVEERAGWWRRRDPGERSREALDSVFRDAGMELRRALR